MKAFVTGGSGLIGYHLVRGLLKEGYEVTCLLHDHTGVFDGLGINLVVADITDKGSLVPYLKGMDVVFHLAAIISLDDDEAPKINRINVGGTKAITAAAQEAGVPKFIYFSSIHVFDYEDPKALLTEDNPFVSEKTKPHPDAYTLSKVEAHKHILSLIDTGYDATIIVPTGVIGPHPTAGIMNGVIKDTAHKSIAFLTGGGFNWVDARDVASAAIAAATRGQKRSYLIAGSFHSLKEIVALSEKVIKRKIFSLYVPIWFIKLLLPLIPKSQGFNAHSLHYLAHGPKKISTAAAQGDLGYTSRPITSSIKDIL